MFFYGPVCPKQPHNIAASRKAKAEFEDAQHSNTGHSTTHGTPPDALAIALDVWKTDGLWLQGWYSIVDAEYDVQYSSLHPYLKIEQRNRPLNLIYWDRWLKRRPVMTNLEFIGGNAFTHLGDFPLHFSYYQLDEEAFEWWHSAQVASLVFDKLWAVRTYRPLSENASVQLTYARAARGDQPNINFWGEPLGPIGDQQLLQLEFLLGF